MFVCRLQRKLCKVQQTMTEEVKKQSDKQENNDNDNNTNNKTEIIIKFDKLKIRPNECELCRELSINGTFKSSQSFNGKWIISYVVDSAWTQHVINLGEIVKQEILSDNKPNTLEFKASEIKVSDINDSTLFNTGLLKLQLMDIGQEKPKEIISVNVVTQITKQDNKFIRTFFNPLE